MVLKLSLVDDKIDLTFLPAAELSEALLDDT
jgi:hypothetical protein